MPVVCVPEVDLVHSVGRLVSGLRVHHANTVQTDYLDKENTFWTELVIYYPTRGPQRASREMSGVQEVILLTIENCSLPVLFLDEKVK